ncbi:MAG TPA: translation initiation factor IF-2 [Caulobacteraceae bacterium]|nr:translation initiation factor IF-2 [Caulobacteraceae bacterium]
MTDANDNENRPGGRAPLTLKPRTGAVSSGTVKQSFSHGRSKTVVVETKRRRVDTPPPAAAPRPTFDIKPRPQTEPPPRPLQNAAPQNNLNLSPEELRTRQRALEAAREMQERQAAERQAADARRAEEEAARRREAEAAKAAAAPPEAPAPAPEARAEARPEPRVEVRAEARPEARSEPRPEPAHAQAEMRSSDRPPRQDAYRQDAPRQDGYRSGSAGGAPQRTGGPPREGGPPRDGRRDDRHTGGTTTFRSDRPRPEGGGYDRGPRPEGGRPPFREGGAPRGDNRFGDRGPPRDRDSAPAGETVRYSALSPRPAPRGDRPGGPRPPGGRPPPAPATPEIQRATRQAPRSGEVDRRPDDSDDEGGKRGKGAPAKAAVSRTKGEPKRREGRLTIQAVAGDGEDAVERMRSLASVRRAREREKEKRRGGGQQEQARVSRDVVIPDVITVGELAQRMATRGVDVIKFLMRQGLMLKINDVIDNDTAELVATEFGHTVKRVSEADVEEGFLDAEDFDEHMVPRPPVVTVMGHVDHGKTSLLDALRSTDVAEGEHGGITQHIGAYQVRLPDGERVTFLDTPGHAAFSAMRARGANITDIVVLVVAADDGVMPQTIEAIHHARAAGAPLIVAINKMDKPGADSTKVINELLQHEVVVESLGGDTQAIPVSAKAKTGLTDLIEAILLQAEVMDLRANPDRTAEGVVIEAKLDRGRGSVATVLVKRGTLRRGDIVVAGDAWGRVRALVNERGEQVTEAGPSTPVEILGLDTPASPGEPFAVVENEARARELTEYRERLRRERSFVPVGGGVSLADMMAKLQDKKVSELPVIVKADVQGSAEAIVTSLEKISTDEVRARIIHSAAGAITESDVLLAKGANAPILGFNVRASAQARALAEREGVEIRYYAIIYDLLDDIKGVLSGMLAPIQRETFLGNTEVLQVFDISKVGKIAGCRVTEGVVRKGAKVRIIRNDVVLQEMGILVTLKRFKDEVNEVVAGQECGMNLNFNDLKAGDIIECFTVEEIKRSL